MLHLGLLPCKAANSRQSELRKRSYRNRILGHWERAEHLTPLGLVSRFRTCSVCKGRLEGRGALIVDEKKRWLWVPIRPEQCLTGGKPKPGYFRFPKRRGTLSFRGFLHRVSLGQIPRRGLIRSWPSLGCWSIQAFVKWRWTALLTLAVILGVVTAELSSHTFWLRLSWILGSSVIFVTAFHFLVGRGRSRV
jgi:hypothetical protein